MTNTCNYSDEWLDSEFTKEAVYEYKMHPIINYSQYFPFAKRGRGKIVHVRTEPKIGRNDICPKCDSGKKYKHCCITNYQ